MSSLCLRVIAVLNDQSFYHCYRILQQTSHHCAIIVSNEAISLARRIKFDSFENRLRLIERDNTLALYNEYYKFVLNKLEVFSLIEFERVIYLDADSHILRIPDELFDLELRGIEFAAPLAYWERDPCFHTSLMYLKPSKPTYNKIFELAKDMMIRFDMDVLNSYFQHRALSGWFSDGVLVLPYYYVCLTQSADSDVFANSHFKFEFERKICDGSSILHFSVGGKPWNFHQDELVSGYTKLLYGFYFAIVRQIVADDEIQTSVFDIRIPDFVRSVVPPEHALVA